MQLHCFPFHLRISGVDVLVQLLAEVLALAAGTSAVPGILPAGSGLAVTASAAPSSASTLMLKPLAEALEVFLRFEEGKVRGHDPHI